MPSRPSRRAFLGAAGTAVTAGLVAGGQFRSAGPHASGAAAPVPAAAEPDGRYQPGVVHPSTAQANLLAVVADVVGDTGDAEVGGLLAELGRTVLAITGGTDPRLFGFPPDDLTVTIGIGPRLVRESLGQKAGASLPGFADLPRYSRERIAAPARGGDLLIQLCASNALLLPVAASALLDQAGARIRERWRQAGRRGPAVPLAPERTAPRNVLGFIDGIVGPQTPAERQRDLWLPGPSPVADGTIAVFRRMELDLRRFAALSTSEQEAVFGRRRDTGVPLSGGPVTAGPDLGAKTPDGRYLVPVAAHARRAHADVVGVGLMLRRSYSIDTPAPGLLFISFQNDLRTFTATLTHMENSDSLLDFTATTASAVFLVLPGFDHARPLGATLFHSG